MWTTKEHRNSLACTNEWIYNEYAITFIIYVCTHVRVFVYTEIHTYMKVRLSTSATSSRVRVEWYTPNGMGWHGMVWSKNILKWLFLAFIFKYDWRTVGLTDWLYKWMNKWMSEWVYWRVSEWAQMNEIKLPPRILNNESILSLFFFHYFASFAFTYFCFTRLIIKKHIKFQIL